MNDILLVKAYEHFSSAYLLLTRGLKRDFISRFYYGYISVLRSTYNCKGGWHDDDTYNSAPDHIKSYFNKLKAWRIKSDYEYHEGGTHTEGYMEGELTEFITGDIIKLISEGLIPELKRLSINHQNHNGLLYLIIKELEEISTWLKAQKL